MATGYFKQLFHIDEPFTPYVLSGHFPVLEEQIYTEMGRRLTDEEIGATIKNIGAYKAPGPDGFQAIF